jgi:transposase
MKNVRFVGLDVHAQTIAVAVAEPDGGEVRSLGTIPNDPQALQRVLKKLGKPEQLRVCYEAGVTGYVLYWQMTRLGIHCDVIAPTLVPRKTGVRVKTDRLDALKLARCYRAGDLTPVWVPDAAHEALRDLVRAREAAKADQLRARHRVSKFLLRQGRRAPAGVRSWGVRHLQWLRQLNFEQPAQQSTLEDYLHEMEHQGQRVARLERSIDSAVERAPPKMREVIGALQSLRGVAKISAVTLVTELGKFARFSHPRQLMGYCGMVSKEHSSGKRVWRGEITKAGNAHVRRIVVEAAWAYRHRPAIGKTLAGRQREQPVGITQIAWRAQQRLCDRYRKLTARGKSPQLTATAVARELLGFIWAIGVQVEHPQRHLAG